MTTRTVLGGATLLVGLLLLGEAIPGLLFDRDVSRFASDPPSLTVAASAQAQARTKYGSPFARLLYPGSRVDVGVWPANCPRTAATANVANRAYYSRVHLYTLFGVPGPVLEVRCGGTRARWMTT